MAFKIGEKDIKCRVMIYKTIRRKGDIQMTNRSLKCFGIYSVSKYLEEKDDKALSYTILNHLR